MKKSFFTAMVVLVLFVFLVGCSPEEKGDTPIQEADVVEDDVIEDVDVSSSVLATVDGVEITSDEVDAFKMALMQSGQMISDEDALDRLVGQQVLIQTVEKEGPSVSDEELESMILDSLAQQNVSLEEYESQLESQGLTYEGQFDKLRTEVAVQKYFEAEFANASFEVSDEEAEQFYDELTNMTDQELPSFEESKEQVLMILRQQKQQQAAMDLIDELKVNFDIIYN